MSRYRKKPIEVEARQITAGMMAEIAYWCGGEYFRRSVSAPARIMVQTLEGPLAAHSGDWIIKGTRGEFWPVRQDIFAETYEPVAAP